MNLNENKIELCDARGITENMMHQISCTWDAYSSFCEDNDTQDKMAALYSLAMIEMDIKLLQKIVEKIIRDLQ